jgi:peptidoglycan hydrolase-like protein with peptidoglycan-binding domain
MSRVVWASAVIAIGISLTPNPALANGTRSRPPGAHSSTNSSARRAVLAIGAGYASARGSGAVRSLQRHLIALGISPGPVDGRYGPLTAAAVGRLQHARGLPADGIVGPATRTALASGALSEGAGLLQPRGSRSVRLLQARLKHAGFSPGPIDGRYGPLTTQAVKRFQHAHHQPADGIAEPRTKAALAASRNNPRAPHPKPTTRAHGRNRHPNPRPQAPRRPPPAHGNHPAAPATPTPTARHRGHHGVPTALAMIALGALGIAPLLVVLLLSSSRRRLASASSAHEPELAPQPTAVAAAPVSVVPEPTEAHQPEPDATDREHAPEEPQAAGKPPPRAEITATGTPSAPNENQSNGRPPQPPPVDPARVEQVKALQCQLEALGLDPGPVDGHYGPKTTEAVKHLQHISGLRPDGIVGPLTAQLLAHYAPQPPRDDRAERVKALQHQLSWLGFEPGRADGRYGPLTTGAVKRFQQTHHLPADGIVDHATASTLRATITQRPSTDRIDRVKTLQHQLQQLGLKPGPIDGRYGPQTTQAVKRLQQAHDLPVNGIVDPQTHNALQDTLQNTAQP